ncbi:MAG: TrmH family RNA methyltransferase [Treponema sp.]|jgi:TrmH family RNA methyltransferase|nr:TrmH family RNA methyltransferase [Treponema sp.]
MISLQKLATLPRSQRLRKAASIVRNAEHRFVVMGKLLSEEAEYLSNLVALLANDERFSKAATEALEKSQSGLSVTNMEGNKKEFHRSLNTVYHILLTETGRCQADWDFIEATGALDISKRQFFSGMQIYLDDIRSPFNVGSMFRAAESFGAERIWLSPLCADPRHKRAERTAMGCVDILSWERLSREPFIDPFDVQNESKDGNKDNDTACLFSEGPFFALETGGISLPDFSFPAKAVMIVGSEELGVSPHALAAADASLGRVSIPSYGAKGSLNVSVAFGIVMQAWSASLFESYSIKLKQ